MDHLFHNAYTAVETDNSTFNNDQLSSDVLDSITLHSIKSPSDFYHTDNFMHSRRILELRHRYYELSADTGRHKTAGKNAINNSLFERHFLEKRSNVHEHDMFDNRQMFSRRNENPRRGLDGYFKRYFDEVKRQVNKEIYTSWVHRQSNESLPISVKDIQYGYIRQHPLMGVDLVLQLQMPVKRRFLLRNRYTGILFREDNLELDEFLALPEQFLKSPVDPNDFFKNILNMLHVLPFNNNFPDLEGVISFSLDNLTIVTQSVNNIDRASYNMYKKIAKKDINFILPFKGGWDMFKDFMNNFEKVILADPFEVHFRLVIVLFEDVHSPLIVDEDFAQNSTYKQSELTRMLFLKLKSTYKNKIRNSTFQLIIRDDTFSRLVGSSAGAALFSPDDLLFFIDIDIIFSSDLLARIRANTVQYKRVYYPIVFKDHYQGDTHQAFQFFRGQSNITLSETKRINHFEFNPDDGFWVYFAYGMMSVYKCDLQSVGGFNTSLALWNHEDIDLFKKFINSNLTIFSAVDPGLIHTFHNIKCDKNLNAEQMDICLASKMASLNSQRNLANKLYSIKELFVKEVLTTTTLIANSTAKYFRFNHIFKKNRKKAKKSRF